MLNLFCDEIDSEFEHCTATQSKMKDVLNL